MKGRRPSGLSPRTRGNQVGSRVRDPHEGSIPANAGEPSRPAGGRSAPWVYPRERGGTGVTVTVGVRSKGLSPRTRGNPHLHPAVVPSDGSIPANAGDPSAVNWMPMDERVYPRERGGTVVGHGTLEAHGGLSPRTRGNPRVDGGERPRVGSIPANAGEPCRHMPSRPRPRVYPRERGGTSPAGLDTTPVMGLSPRTRGNPPLAVGGERGTGSIPANAGEPPPRWPRARPGTVYPRERGGTDRLKILDWQAEGLSPRTRGNRPAAADQPTDRGSIPANAGEPAPWRRWMGARRVYPRERGGTRSASRIS